jgi:hypothetical protein
MSTDVSAAMSDLWDFAADIGIFTPAVGDPVSCQIRFDKELLSGPDGLETIITDEELRIKVIRSEVGQIPVPRTPTRPGDIFTLDSIDYEVSGIVDQDNVFVTCAVQELE